MVPETAWNQVITQKPAAACRGDSSMTVGRQNPRPSAPLLIPSVPRWLVKISFIGANHLSGSQTKHHGGFNDIKNSRKKRGAGEVGAIRVGWGVDFGLVMLVPARLNVSYWDLEARMCNSPKVGTWFRKWKA